MKQSSMEQLNLVLDQIKDLLEQMLLGSMLRVWFPVAPTEFIS